METVWSFTDFRRGSFFWGYARLLARADFGETVTEVLEPFLCDGPSSFQGTPIKTCSPISRSWLGF